MTTRAVTSNLPAELKTRIEARQAKVAIIGMGYVGLPLALLYVGQKFPVTGFDI
ncbi:MAG: nucleotide sugar dehydrogenase, partial [Acidobacteria bacterium]